MVRAGVVNHPSEWKFSGFNEIQRPRRRYSIIDYKSLTGLLNFDNYDEIKGSHRKWVEEFLAEKEHLRDRRWTESIAACRACPVGLIDRTGVKCLSIFNWGRQ